VHGKTAGEKAVNRALRTIAIGLGGTAIGGGIVLSTAGKHAVSWAGIASFFAAVGLVLAYRRFVQKRPLFGPEALRFPRRVTTRTL